MSLKIHAAALAAGVVAASATFAQTAYPDLKGTWVGPGQSVILGRTEQSPEADSAAPTFR